MGRRTQIAVIVTVAIVALGAAGAYAYDSSQKDKIAEGVRMLRNYGERAKFQNRSWGINSRLDELQAAILRAKLKHLDGWNAERRARARLYGELLGGTELLLPAEVPPARHCFHWAKTYGSVQS